MFDMILQMQALQSPWPVMSKVFLTQLITSSITTSSAVPVSRQVSTATIKGENKEQKYSFIVQIQFYPGWSQYM